MNGHADVQHIKESHLKIITLRHTRLAYSMPSNANILFIPSSNVMIWGGGIKATLYLQQPHIQL
jgi:hypothetical protein